MAYRNTFLAALAADDLTAFADDLAPVDLPLRRRFATPSRAIVEVVFLESGVASSTVTLRRRPPVEVGLVGSEGVVNLAALLGVDRTPIETYMQVAGGGHSIPLVRLRAVMAARPEVTRLILLEAYLALAQAASTVVANTRGTLTERLARWLLMVHDRVEGDRLVMTHEAVAALLGVRRSGVTTAVGELERLGLLTGQRGRIDVLDRAGLETAAHGFYGLPETEAARLHGRALGGVAASGAG